MTPLHRPPTPATEPASSPDTVTVRPARRADLPAVTALHLRELPTGLFPRLGPRFLSRWHQAHLSSEHGVVLVAVRADPDGARYVVGFLTADLDHAAFVDDVLTTRAVEMACTGLAALACRPRLAASFVRTRAAVYLRRMSARRAAPQAPDVGDRAAVAELSAIAVHRDARDTGVGGRLLEAFWRRCVEVGVPTAELVTGARASGAIRFYRRHGWTDLGEETAYDGERVRRFRLTFPHPAR